MACDEWKERWIDELYGELDPEEGRFLRSHLAACPTCREEMRELAAVREILKDAEPVVPVAPRVVILGGSRERAPVWALAAGLAALGLLAGLALSWSWQARTAAASLASNLAAVQEKSGSEPVAPALAADEVDRRVRDGIERYLAERSSAGYQLAGSPGAATPLTAAELDARLLQLDRKIDRARASDLQYVFDQLAVVEARNTARFGETQEAIRYVALASDPTLSEQ
jgi:anti-sigma factor RsiW